MDENSGKEDEVGRPRTGTGALCPEAQADGVPCTELGKECPECEKALPRSTDAGTKVPGNGNRNPAGWSSAGSA